MPVYPNGRGNRLKSDSVWVRIPRQAHWTFSSVGQSASLTWMRPGVQVPHRPQDPPHFPWGGSFAFRKHYHYNVAIMSSFLFGSPAVLPSVFVHHGADLSAAVVTVELSGTDDFKTVTQTIAEGVDLIVTGTVVELKTSAITGTNGDDAFYRVKADGAVIATGRLIKPDTLRGVLRRRGTR